MQKETSKSVGTWIPYYTATIFLEQEDPRILDGSLECWETLMQHYFKFGQVV